MNQLTVTASPSGLGLAKDSSRDTQLVHIWLSTKTSSETRRAYAGEITRFLAFVQKPLAQVTLADLQGYVEGLARGVLKIASQNRALTAIKSALSFGQETGYLPFNAGVRAAKLCGLKWCDALPRQEGGQITVFGKGGKTRTILLKPKVWQQLLSVKGAASAVDSIFRSRNGGGQLDTSQVRRIVYAAARKAGLEKKVSPHWLRHAHASHALERAAPIHLVQATLGHASLSTTGRYLHARPTESSSFYLPD